MLSWTHIVVVAGITLLLFGRGRISDMMGDVAKGIKSFKKGLSDEPDSPLAETPAERAGIPPAVEHRPAEAVRPEERAPLR